MFLVALAWLLANPAVACAVIGPRTREQLEGSLRGAELTLDAEALRRLDAAFPGPGGAAPEAYAWWLTPACRADGPACR